MPKGSQSTVLLPSLQKIRRKQFMTQDQLAHKAKVARSTIAEIESLRRPARYETMQKLADALGVEPSTLIGH